MEPAAATSHAARPTPGGQWERLEAYAGRGPGPTRLFLFLAVPAGDPVSPSKAVDQAWHHLPSKGGEEEANRPRRRITQTPASYRRQFRQKPPGDIGSPAMAMGVARPTSKRKVTAAGLLSLIGSFAVGLKAYGFDPRGTASPGTVDLLATRGPEFLWFYGLLILVAGLGVLLLRGLLQAVPPRRPSADWQPEAPELAFVAEGSRHALTAALLALTEKKTVVVKQGVAYLNPTGKEPAQGLETAVVEGLRGWGCGRELATFIRHLEQHDPRVHQLANNLQTWGLVLSPRRKRLALWGQALLLAPVLLLGLTRLGRGVAAGRPVGYLLLELGLLIAGLVWLAKNPVHASWPGLRLMRQQRLRLQQPREQPAGGSLAQAYALFGMGALPALMALQLVHPPPLPARNPGGAGGGGGADGAGGSGDGGGGGCGGGCGGCGG